MGGKRVSICRKCNEEVTFEFDHGEYFCPKCGWSQTESKKASNPINTFNTDNSKTTISKVSAIIFQVFMVVLVLSSIIIGMAVGKMYSASSLIGFLSVPGIIFLIAYFLSKKLVKGNAALMPLLTLHLGHVFWIICGFITLGYIDSSALFVPENILYIILATR